MNDAATNELYSRIAQGNIQREIRILNTSGVAGHVFSTGGGGVALGEGGGVASGVSRPYQRLVW
jgi:hypothetical protein